MPDDTPEAGPATPAPSATPARAPSTEETRPTVRVHLPTPFVRLFPEAPRFVDLEATTVREAVDALEGMWPGMRDRLVDERPAIRRHINVFVDGERVGLEEGLRKGVEVWVLTAVSGG